jgi:hypothetical protein
VVLISFVNANRYEEVVRQSLYETTWEIAHISPRSADIMMPLLLSKNIREKSSTSRGLDVGLVKYANGDFMTTCKWEKSFSVFGIKAYEAKYFSKFIVGDNEQSSPSTVVYITNFGKKYHKSNCIHLKKSKIPILLRDAISKGYGRCKVCYEGFKIEDYNKER